MSERRKAVQKAPSSESPPRGRGPRGGIAAHPGGHHHRLGDHAAADPGLAVGGVQEHIGEALPGQGAVPEGGHLAIEVGADAADLDLGDAAVKPALVATWIARVTWRLQEAERHPGKGADGSPWATSVLVPASAKLDDPSVERLQPCTRWRSGSVTAGPSSAPSPSRRCRPGRGCAARLCSARGEKDDEELILRSSDRLGDGALPPRAVSRGDRYSPR